MRSYWPTLPQKEIKEGQKIEKCTEAEQVAKDQIDFVGAPVAGVVMAGATVGLLYVHFGKHEFLS